MSETTLPSTSSSIAETMYAYYRERKRNNETVNKCNAWHTFVSVRNAVCKYETIEREAIKIHTYVAHHPVVVIISCHLAETRGGTRRGKCPVRRNCVFRPWNERHKFRTVFIAILSVTTKANGNNNDMAF